MAHILVQELYKIVFTFPVPISDEMVDSMLTEYRRQRSGHVLDDSLLQGWAGIEIIRRLLGVAQLPLDRSLEEKRRLLDWAVQACLE